MRYGDEDGDVINTKALKTFLPFLYITITYE